MGKAVRRRDPKRDEMIAARQRAEMFVLDFAERWDMTQTIMDRYENDMKEAERAERERCAKIAEGYYDRPDVPSGYDPWELQKAIADTIRKEMKQPEERDCWCDDEPCTCDELIDPPGG